MNHKKNFKHIIKRLDPIAFKRDLQPLQLHDKIIYIKKVYSFSGLKNGYPFLFFETKQDYHLLGLTLARQSSDLLLAMAKRIYSTMKRENKLKIENPKIIQYRIPRDLSSLKLIILKEWSDPDEFETITLELQKFQKEFIEGIDKIISGFFD